MMKVIGNATVGNEQQMLNLCECAKIVGADVYIKGNTVYAEFEGNDEQGELLADIFRQYPFHGISILS